MRRNTCCNYNYKVSVAARMWGRAQLLVLLAASVAVYGDDVQEESVLKVGRSIDIFTRYGYLSLSMRVVPRNDSDFLFREPTVNIFTDLEDYAIRPAKGPAGRRRVFEGDFHMEFCDNQKQLLQAYFRDFSFERLENPWRAFTASWTAETVAKHLGINSSFIHKDYCYVLVRLSRFRDNVKLSRVPNNIFLNEEVAQVIDDIQVGEVAGILNFIQKYGSHYINSYVTGNSLYQVFVFRKSNYLRIKDRLKTQGISHLDSLELGHYFSPWFAEHMGNIRSASGNRSVEEWATTKLRVHYYIFTYPTLLKIYGDPHMLSVLNGLLQNEAILEMEMKSLAPAFKDPAKRAWFEEVLDNFLKLWESNL